MAFLTSQILNPHHIHPKPSHNLELNGALKWELRDREVEAYVGNIIGIHLPKLLYA